MEAVQSKGLLVKKHVRVGEHHPIHYFLNTRAVLRMRSSFFLGDYNVRDDVFLRIRLLDDLCYTY